MDAFFTKLGRTILERWKQANFSLEKFPDIASTAIDERPPAKHVKLPVLMRDFMLSDEQPFQTDSDFGEPELVAYSHPRFYIQLLFWMDGTTAIHQHEFSGAFHVMRGSSIHAHYEFEKPKPVTPYLRIGDLKMKTIELLETGRTVPIISGQKTIHSLFHLDSPSVTVVVRTQNDPGTGPQFNYLPPHVAIDPHFSDKLTMRRKQLLAVMEQMEDDGYAEMVKEMVADLDFERGFSILYHCMGYLQHLGEWEPVMEVFENKHGTLAQGVAETLKEDSRRGLIKGLRSTITDPEHRLFLALLMNAPTRADLFALVKQRFPDEAPAEVVLRWLTELLEVTDEGVAVLDASIPEELQIDLDAQPELLLVAIRHFMKGGKALPPPLRQLPAAGLKAIRGALESSALRVLLG